MKLTISDLRVIKGALDVVPSYVLEKQHKTMYDAVRLSSMIGMEIDKNEKMKELAERQNRIIRKAKAEAMRQSSFVADKSKLNSKLEKNAKNKAKNKKQKRELEFPGLNFEKEKKGVGYDQKAIDKRNRKDRG